MKNEESISGLEPETSRLEVGCSIRIEPYGYDSLYLYL